VTSLRLPFSPRFVRQDQPSSPSPSPSPSRSRKARLRARAFAFAVVACAGGLAVAACEDRTGGDVLTRPGTAPDASAADGSTDAEPASETGVDAGDGGAALACPPGSKLPRERTACLDGGAPLAAPAELVTALGAAGEGDVVSMYGLREGTAPCLPVLVCTPDDAPTLLFSDSPESPASDGVLYADTVPAGRYRLYVYHANGGDELRKFPIVALNQGAQAANVTIVRKGLAEPSKAYVAQGKAVLTDWLAGRAPAVVVVPPGQRVLLDAALDALHAGKDDLVNAIYDVVVDRPVKISFVSVLASADAAATTAGLSLLPRDVDHQRGTFANADVLVTLAGVPRSGVSRLRLGLDEVDETLEGVDAPTGVKQRLLGNYGMQYRFALALPGGIPAALSPRGGPWGGVAQLRDADGGITVTALPSAASSLGTTTDAIALGRTAAGREIRMLSAGGSNLPVDLFFVVP